VKIQSTSLYFHGKKCIFVKMIQRKKIKEFINLLNLFPVLAITGPRQCGKTTIAKELIKYIAKETIYLDMESGSDRNKLIDPELFFEDNINKCIIIDEIQFYPEIFPLLRSSIDKQRDNARFIILGSASPKLIKQSSESLAGRIAYEELSPFNLEEIGTEEKDRHWLRGGFPDSFLAKSDANSFIWLKNFINTYIYRDLISLGLNTSSVVLNNFLVMLSHNQGDVFNQNNFSRSLGVSSPTIKKYLYFLEESYFIRILKPYHFNIKKRLVKSPKVYIRDTGVLHYLNQITDSSQLVNTLVIGASWESYVIEQIYQMLSMEISVYYYRTHHGTECDLVLVKGLLPIASIEIKYSSSPKLTKGFVISIDDLKTKYNYIITPSSDMYRVRKDITVCSLSTFIESEINKIHKL